MVNLCNLPCLLEIETKRVLPNCQYNIPNSIVTPSHHIPIQTCNSVFMPKGLLRNKMKLAQPSLLAPRWLFTSLFSPAPQNHVIAIWRGQGGPENLLPPKYRSLTGSAIKITARPPNASRRARSEMNVGTRHWRWRRKPREPIWRRRRILPR